MNQSANQQLTALFRECCQISSNRLIQICNLFYQIAQRADAKENSLINIAASHAQLATSGWRAGNIVVEFFNYDPHPQQNRCQIQCCLTMMYNGKRSSAFVWDEIYPFDQPFSDDLVIGVLPEFIKTQVAAFQLVLKYSKDAEFNRLSAAVKEAQQERLKVVKAATLKEQKAVEHLLKTI